MAPITAFDVSINLNLRGLKAIKTLLEKASSQSSAGIVPITATEKINDIPSLAFHVQACTNLAAGGHSLLTRTEQDAPTWTADETTTLDDLISHAAETIAQIEKSGVRPVDLAGVEDQVLPVKYGNGETASWGGREYILGYNIPNFMFHLCAVYSELRSQGVEVGKIDYLMPFMEGMAP